MRCKSFTKHSTEMQSNNGIWLPAEIWELDLPPLHRVFLARLIALSKQDGASWAGDEFLAESLRCTPQHVRKMRRQLEESGYIVTEGYGHKRRLFVEVAPTGTSNHRNKQPQAQELQPEAQKLRPQMRQEATTVAESIEENRTSKEVVKNRDDESFSEFETVQEPEAAPTNPARGARAKRQRVFHDVVLPWETETFKAAWREWLDYKWDQHRFAFKQARYEQTALHNLQKDSNGNEELAIHIIATSIASGWKGLIANSAKSYKGPRTGSSGYFHSSGKYKHPSEVIKDRDIWG
jgi:DNA-binding MarR family transcriptional regulator